MFARTSISFSAATRSGRQSHSLFVHGFVSRAASGIWMNRLVSGVMGQERDPLALFQTVRTDRLESPGDVHQGLFDTQTFQRTCTDKANAFRNAIHQLLRVFRPGERTA